LDSCLKPIGLKVKTYTKDNHEEKPLPKVETSLLPKVEENPLLNAYLIEETKEVPE